MFHHSAARPRLILGLVAACIAAPVAAHEDRHTHAELSVAAVHFLDSPNVANEERRLGWQAGTIAALLRQGAIDEDKCPLYSNHFYNPAAPDQLIAPAHNWLDDNCSYYTSEPNYLPDPYYDSDNPDYDKRIPQQSAVDRAASNWNESVARYERGELREAYLLLGHVFHLMQDMTSPAHVHNDPHGKARFQGGDGDCYWQQDADDFENWGWCPEDENVAAYQHIFDYLEQHGVTGPDGTNLKAPMRDGLNSMFGGRPQFAERQPTENPARVYVRRVAEVTFGFTTFEVKLRDEELGSDPQPASELKSMFPGLREAGNDAFGIDDDGQDIGFSDGHCGRWEAGFDWTEEWWPMEHSSRWPCVRTTWGNDNTLTLNGFAYIENSGGEGAGSGGTWDSLTPQQYFKDLYVARYGSSSNAAGRTQLRIYGDVLYPTAVAYGAGLLQTFVEEVLDPPVADAGGPYDSDGCTPIEFDASASHDRNADGSIVSYAWDFENDGVLDLTTGEPVVAYTYAAPYDGPARLVVTDDDGFSGEATADVSVDPDQEPPTIHSVVADPNRLWPPNHKFIPVTVAVAVTDRCGATCSIVEVASNEGSGRGRGRGSDWRITGDLTLDLRAERLGSGDGRVYTITVACSDPAGNASQGTTVVRVSHDNGNGNGNGGENPSSGRSKHRPPGIGRRP